MFFFSVLCSHAQGSGISGSEAGWFTLFILYILAWGLISGTPIQAKREF